MSRFRLPSARTLVAVLAAPLLAAALPARTATADIVHFTDTYYSSASYSTVVGSANGYCDGDYIFFSGYGTAYRRTRYVNQCP